MKKIILMVALVMSAFLGANAQTQHEIAVSGVKPLDNMYIGISAGALTPLDLNHMFPLNTAASVKIGKDFTPVFGLNAEGLVMFGSNHFNESSTFVRATNVGVNSTVNLTNLFLGYNADKVFTLSTEAGLGWIHQYGNFNNVAKTLNQNDLTAKTGLVFAWALGQSKAFRLVAEPQIYWNLTQTDQVAFNKHNAQLGLQLGFVYNFLTSNGTHNFKEYDITAINNNINKLREDLAKKPKVVKETETVTKTVTIDKNEWVVLFAWKSAQLDSKAKATLDEVPTNVTCVVNGLASPEGTAAFNKQLSQDRANAVKSYLEGRGIKVTSAEGLGVIGDSSNRLAIVNVAE
jgi:outer membrane protein OmpA-like peptidoglycan-associated protein